MIFKIDRKWVISSLIAAVFTLAPAMANVSLKNGNFFIGFTDVAYQGGFEMKMERIYNSKSSFKGFFGWGWGTEYEANLSVSADGSVVVHEYGGGAENRFQSTKFTQKDMEEAINNITNAAKSAGILGTPKQISEYSLRVRSDAGFRNTEWQKWVSQNRLKPRKLPAGTQLQSNRFSYQYITKVADGYIRAYENGRVEKFDEEGKLTQISDPNGNFLKFEHAADRKISKVTDNFNRKMFFSFNNRGFLEKIQGEGGQSAEYKYNNQDELVWSRDAAKNVHEYQYSNDQRHNLVQITYPDKRTQKVVYYDRKQHENVRSVTDKDDAVTEYIYKDGSPNGANRMVGVTLKGTSGKIITTNSYEYFFKKKPTGEDWTYRMITTLDGEKTDTTYNECCGLPVVINKNGERTTFDYDGKGRVTKKVTPTETTELAYDARFGKVTRVVKTTRAEPAQARGKQIARATQTTWSEFQYDPKGNLVFARNAEKRAVKVAYDRNGRIASMADQSGRRIEFRYNELSKPVEIKDPKLGSIEVTYGNDGSVKKVASPAGRKIAMEVTSAFQSLLDIVRPAGVTLSF